ncbi:hypothetical protein ACFXAZ_09010 [Streptomyces sp. NPDC059477]|uniref:hypothetical protein n=1 Tax=Streptomyces sp. NPDC059477 TaxID=3346847 RepID=UPI0036869958
MTPVDTTPPLPVRHRPAPGDQPPGALSPMLTRLAAEQATGVLHRERGILHLTDGAVVYAESPSAPGAEELLGADLDGEGGGEGEREGVAGNAQDRPAPADPPAPGPPPARDPAPPAVPQGALELCRLGALYDAAYFALAPSSAPGRFRYVTAAPPVGPRAVPVAVLERSVVRRRALLDRIWPDERADTAPLVRAERAGDPPGAVRSVTARQRAVLDRVDGVRTAPEIARELRRQAFHTLVDVRRLAAAGLVHPQPPPGASGVSGIPGLPDPHDRSDPHALPDLPGLPDLPDLPDWPGSGGPAAPPEAEGALPWGAVPEVTAPQAADPDITLLKRLRDALEAL